MNDTIQLQSQMGMGVSRLAYSEASSIQGDAAVNFALFELEYLRLLEELLQCNPTRDIGQGIKGIFEL